MTLGEYMHTRFEDPRLIGLLESQWMNYGVEPKGAAFAMHAIVVNHYLRGAWFPVGGGEALVDALRRVIENGGGQCLTGHRVDEILVERNRAVGVRGHSAEADREFEVRAPAVISNAGARITFDTLLPRRPFPEISDALAAQPSSPGTLAVFSGSRRRPPPSESAARITGSSPPTTTTTPTSTTRTWSSAPTAPSSRSRP